MSGNFDVMAASFLGHVIFGQAFLSYLFGWRISIGPGASLGDASCKYGRDLMGAFVLAGFVLMLFFRGY